jgi:hypothetical protein
MSTSFLRPALAAIACAAAVSFITPASAEVVNLKAEMTAKNEVPPNQSGGKGEVTATYDTATKKLSWKGTYSGLSGAATAAHFHGPAAAGKNAGVVIPIFAGAAAKSPFEGSATLTDAQAQQLLSGQWYANIHTAANKGGEIRGQVTK